MKSGEPGEEGKPGQGQSGGAGGKGGAGGEGTPQGAGGVGGGGGGGAAGTPGPPGPRGEEPRGGRIWRTALTLWIITFTIVTFINIRVDRGLARQNHQRITDIQQSRVSSCEDTYAAITAILNESVKGRHLTPPQQENMDRLRAIISPTKCVKQTKP